MKTYENSGVLMSPDESWTWTATTFRMELLSHDKGWQGSKGQGGQNLSVLGLDRPLGTRLDLVSWGPNDIEMTKCPKTRRSSKHIPRFSKHIGFSILWALNLTRFMRASRGQGWPRHHNFLLEGNHDNFTGRQGEGRLDLTWHQKHQKHRKIVLFSY